MKSKDRTLYHIFFMKGENEMKEFITLRTGEVIVGQLVRVYNAFEGGKRFIFRTSRGEYRCVKDENGNFKEYVA